MSTSIVPRGFGDISKMLLMMVAESKQKEARGVSCGLSNRDALN